MYMTSFESSIHPGDVRTLIWDPLNRLTAVQTPTVSVQYRYDAFGRRIARSVTTASGTTEVRYLFDGQNVRAEQDATGTWTAANVHAGLDQMLLRDDFAAGQSYYLHADALGSTLALSDANGAVVETYRYSAYGQVAIYDVNLNPLPSGPGTPALCPYLFTGRDYEPELGLYNYRARSYDPGLGRFISRDPLGFGGGDVNLYAYVGGNVFGFIDPLGLEGRDQRGPGQVGMRSGTDYLWDAGESALSFAAGLGDAVSFGATTWAAKKIDTMLMGEEAARAIDDAKSSTSFAVGEGAALFIGSGRLAYAGLAKGASLTRLAVGSSNYAGAVGFRNGLKAAFRLGLADGYKMYTPAQMLSKYGSASAVISASGRTNNYYNTAAAWVAAGATRLTLT